MMRYGAWVVVVLSVVLMGQTSQGERRPVRIMPMGDSITVGGGTGGYRGVLAGALRDGGYSVEFVGSKAGPGGRHEGTNGISVDRLDRVAAARVRAAQPDIILLMIGVNDLAGSDQDARVVVRELGVLLDHLQQARPETMILVGSVPPIRDLMVRRQAYNREMSRLVGMRQQTSNRIKFVQIATDLDARGDMADRVHPNRKGFSIMAQQWQVAVEGVLQ